MNPAKSEIKIALTEVLGRSIETTADSIKDHHMRHVGGKEAFAHAAAKIGELNAVIDKDLEDGVVADVVGEPLQVVKFAKRYVKRAIGICDNLATAAEIAVHESRGREKGMRDAAKLVLKSWHDERTKLESFVAALETSKSNGKDIDARALDGHPGPTLKAQRTTEKAVEKPKKRSKAEPKIAKVRAKKTPARRPSAKDVPTIKEAIDGPHT